MRSDYRASSPVVLALPEVSSALIVLAPPLSVPPQQCRGLPAGCGALHAGSRGGEAAYLPMREQRLQRGCCRNNQRAARWKPIWQQGAWPWGPAL